MKKQIATIGAILIGSIGCTLGRSYPIKEIITNDCKPGAKTCSYALPHITDANYLKFKNDSTYRKTYTMLRSTTYYDGRDIGLGGHQGIDIASNEGTLVLAVKEGEVIFAGEKGSWGKTITIKHIEGGKTIYSSYAHLSEILVKNGDNIKESGLIGKVGTTGNSTGPHLHFQIEINDDNNHPFFYKNCIGEIPEIVNEGRCLNQMTENTVDPILFIEKNGNIPLLKAVNTPTTNNNYGDYTNLIFSGFSGGLLDKGFFAKINITPKINSGTLFILNSPIKIQYDKKIVKILPDSFDVVKNKQILIIPQTTGFTSISFIYKNKVIKKFPLIITDENFMKNIRSVLNKNPNILKSLYQ